MKYDIEKISYEKFCDRKATARTNFMSDDVQPWLFDWERINKNQCWYCRYGTYVYLRSYNTIVAKYNITTHVVSILGYFSATTCQHVNKFIRLMDEIYDVYIVRYLYERSDRIAYIDYCNNIICKWYKSLK